MKKTATYILFLISIGLVSTSCSLLFNNENYIERKRIPQHELYDVYIYSTFDKSKIDSFIVTNYVNSYDYDEFVNSQLIKVALNSQMVSESFFIITVLEKIGIIDYKNGYFTYEPEDETKDFILNDVSYSDVYVIEEDTRGDSDSIINRLRYHGKAGVISYRFENGDEFLLDTIIKAE